MNYDFGVGRIYVFKTSHILLVSLLFGIYYLIHLRKKKYSIYKNLIILSLWIYIYSVLAITLEPIPLNLAAIKCEQVVKGTRELWNLIPFYEFNYSFVRRQFILNMIMLFPFGVLIPLYKKNITFKKFFIYLLSLVLFIEFTQLAFCLVFDARSWFFDVNDIMANLIGGVIGYYSIELLKPLIFRFVDEKAIYGCE